MASGALRSLSVVFEPRDSKCHSSYAAIRGVELYYWKHVDVFFGPSCEYALGESTFMQCTCNGLAKPIHSGSVSIKQSGNQRRDENGNALSDWKPSNSYFTKLVS